ncbi:hypothetical protein ACLB2K_002323 [Fragaria x ananassa]
MGNTNLTIAMAEKVFLSRMISYPKTHIGFRAGDARYPHLRIKRSSSLKREIGTVLEVKDGAETRIGKIHGIIAIIWLFIFVVKFMTTKPHMRGNLDDFTMKMKAMEIRFEGLGSNLRPILQTITMATANWYTASPPVRGMSQSRSGVRSARRVPSSGPDGGEWRDVRT